MDTSILILSSISVAIISLISLTGVFALSLSKRSLNKLTMFFVSLAAGTMIGDVFIHLIPESFSSASNPDLVGVGVILGIMIFFILEKIIHWRHCHAEETSDHIHPLAFMNIVGDGVHNFLDGVIIAASYSISLEVGIATTIAVVLHEIPQEIGDFGVLVHAGMKVKKALLLNFASGLVAFAGMFFALYLYSDSDKVEQVLVPIAAGGLLYIAIADLIPELKHEENVFKNILQVGLVVVGIAAMFLLTLFE